MASNKLAFITCDQRTVSSGSDPGFTIQDATKLVVELIQYAVSPKASQGIPKVVRYARLG